MATDASVLVLLVELFGLHVTASTVLASTIGAMTKFVLGKLWAFRDRSPLRLVQIACFVGMAAGSIVLVGSSMHLLSAVLGLPYPLAKVLCGAFAFFCFSYPVQSRFVFKPREPSP